MNGFEKLLAKIERYNVDRILFEVWSNSKVQIYVEQLNTEGQNTSQLYNQGVNSLGVSLGEYSPFTINEKLNGDGLGDRRVDHITLKDMGDFYESVIMKPFIKGFNIDADAQKDDDNLFDIYGKDILGLTDENLQLLIEFIRPFYMDATKKIVR